MRELSVYYCSKCGRYGYYYISKNAVCQDCQTPMNLLPISYQDFMNLDFAARDQLIADQLTENLIPHSSILQKILAISESSSVRIETAQLCTAIEELEEENARLRQENKELEHTISWMHELIWDLTRRLHS